MCTSPVSIGLCVCERLSCGETLAHDGGVGRSGCDRGRKGEGEMCKREVEEDVCGRERDVGIGHRREERLAHCGRNVDNLQACHRATQSQTSTSAILRRQRFWRTAQIRERPFGLRASVRVDRKILTCTHVGASLLAGGWCKSDRRRFLCCSRRNLYPAHADHL